MEVDWDLQAVVRGFTTTASSSTTTTSSSTTSTTSTTTNGGSSFKPDFTCFDHNKQVGQLFTISDPFEEKVKGDIGELHELFRPFFPKSQTFYSPQAPPLSSLPPSSVYKEQTHPKQQTKPSFDQKHTKPSHASSSSTTPRSKRRKNQVKKVCHIPAEALSSDVWAWRKYGQKPIKGSPFPRGYYRCSSSKGCLARKQVERNRSDPRMFIVTFTAEHNHPAPTHRNSLAGSTRQKTSTPQNITTTDSEKLSPKTPPKPECSFPATSLEEELLPHSSNTDSREEKDMMEDEDCEGQEADFGGFSGTEVDDDFFAGLEEFACPNNSGGGFSDHFTGSIGFQWFSSAAATTTTGGV